MLSYETITELASGPLGGLWDNRPERETVLLLHGFGGSGMSWMSVARALSDAYRVIAPDLPGHGRSRGLFKEATLASFALVIEEAIAQLDAGPVHLIGHSMGGALALLLVKRGVLPISSLTLISCAGVGDGSSTAFFDRYVGADSEDAMREVLRLAFGLHASPTLVMARSSFNELADGDGRRLLTELSAMAKRPRYAPILALSEFRGPIGVIWGEQDLITPADHALAFAPWTPDIHILPEVGHLAHIEAPDKVIALIRNVIGSPLRGLSGSTHPSLDATLMTIKGLR